MTQQALLRGVRVLEVGPGTGVRYAGRLLADLGAQVSQQVDRTSASQGPSDRKARALDRYLDRGKQTVGRPAVGAWDLVLLEGAERLAEADFEAATSDSGHVPVVVSVADEMGADLCASARGGVSWVIGDPKREPLSLPYNIPGFLAGTSAAAAGLVALRASKDYGAQQVTVSADSILAWVISMNSVVTRYGSPWHREGRRAAGSGGPYPYAIFDCADGQVTIITRSSREWENFIEAIGHPSWADEPRYQDQIAMGSEYPDEVDALLAPVLKKFTQRELLERAQEFGFALAPVNSMRDVLEEDHFQERGSWQHMEFDGATVAVPSAPWRLLPGRSKSDDVLRPPRTKPAEGSGPLSGLRILDLSWVWSGPLVTSVLADFGAEVIKVEHGGRLDSSRLRGRPLKGGEPVEGPSIEIAPYFHNVNRGKKSVALDLSRPEARVVLRELASQSDVVVENMRVGVLERLGLGWEQLQAINPEMVYLAMSGAGQTGPLANMRAYAPIMSSIAGLESLIGYPGEDPIGMMTLGLGDPNAALHGLTALLAALRSVGEGNPGVMIDLSQTESLLPLVAEALLDQQFNGDVEIRGNTEPGVVPRGIYPTTGEDRWIAVSVPNDAVWRRFCQTVLTSTNVRRPQGRGDVSWALSSRFHALDGRAANRGELDAAIATWSADFHPAQLLALLKENGVPAAPVNRHFDLDEDPILGHGSLWTYVDQPISGRTNLSRIPWTFSTTPPQPRGPAPLLGQHTRQVLVEVLGMDDADVDELLSSAAIA